MRLDLDALQTNIRIMAAWTTSRGVSLAPHVKTTMSRPIVERQLAAGAAGVAVATVEQAEIVADWGVGAPILLANEVLDQDGLARLRDVNGRHPFGVTVMVDSLEGVAAAARGLGRGDRPLCVLVDVGTPGGRTGVRLPGEARQVAQAVAGATGLRLSGTSGYEGVVENARTGEVLASVDAHCQRIVEVFAALAPMYETDEPLLSIGGSVFPDRVVAAVPASGPVSRARVQLRSGCYVTHDHGVYLRTSPVVGLVPAVTVRAVVVSQPEPGVAVIGAGKRELPHDAGPPMVVGASGGRPTERTPPAGSVTAMYDHHCVVSGTDLAVGEIVHLGISHPCSVFARWDAYLVTRGDEVVDVWPTEFRRGRSEESPRRG